MNLFTALTNRVIPWEFPACAGMNRHEPSVSGVLVVEFPACAGMNRCTCPRSRSQARVPRMRGDEPLDAPIDDKGPKEFPACAGMNRFKGGSNPPVG